jgi:multiple sugar transport system substrate-binding protein
MSRRPVTSRIAGLLALGIALTGISCGGGGSSDRVTVSLLVFGEAEELRAYRHLAQTFEDRQEDVAIELIEVADRQALITRLATTLAAGDPPDLFLINYRFFGQFAARGALEPLQPRLDRSSELDESAFYSLALDAFRYPDDDLVCLPQNVSSLVVYFNKALFRSAGVPEPSAEWSWDEMVGAAQQLTTDGQHGLGIEPSIIRLAPLVWSNGGEIVDDPRRPTRLTLDSPQALEALDRFLQLGTSGVIPTAEESAAEDDESRFANGRLAMLVQSRRVTPQFRQIEGFEWDVAPFPGLTSPANVLHSDAYCLTKDSKHHDAAWRFLEFALGEDGATAIAGTGRTVPSLRTVAESDAFLDPKVPPASSHVFLDSIPVIRSLPTISTWPEVESVADEILAEARQNGTPAAEVARRLDEQTRGIFARAEG